jgi:carboxypeptidase D
MFGRSIAAVLAIALLINGGQAKQPNRGRSKHHTRHARPEPVDTSNYRFLTNETKCMLHSVDLVPHTSAGQSLTFHSSCRGEPTGCPF